MKKFKAFKSIGLLLMIFTLIGLFGTSLIVKNAFADEECDWGCQECIWTGEEFDCNPTEEQGSWCFCRQAQNPETELCKLSWHYRCFPPI